MKDVSTDDDAWEWRIRIDQPSNLSMQGDHDYHIGRRAMSTKEEHVPPAPDVLSLAQSV